MKLLADECCYAALVAALRLDGHDVLFVVDSLRGSTDDEILNTPKMKAEYILLKTRILVNWCID